jgi:hypothetical protein
MAALRLYWGVVLSLTLAGGCAFTPTPVILAEKPSQYGQGGPNGLKIAVVVRDARPTAIQQAHLCGIKCNSFMIPTSFAFLAHPETYDKLVAFHVKRILERSGFDVVAALPAVPEQLSTQSLTQSPSELSVVFAAMNEQGKDASPGEVKEGGELKVSNLDESESRPSWSGLKDADRVDAILDINITSLGCGSLQGFVFVSTQGWCKTKVTLCNPKEMARAVVWGKAYSGFGTSGPRLVITDDCYTMALNMAYWIMLEDLERQVRSPEFQALVRNAKRQPAT